MSLKYYKHLQAYLHENEFKSIIKTFISPLHMKRKAKPIISLIFIQNLDGI